MKHTLSLLIAALSLATCCNKAMAQKDTSTAAVFKTWDDLLLKVKKEKKANATSFAEADPKLNATRDQWTAGITKSIAAKSGTEPWKEWTLTNQHTGEINLLPRMVFYFLIKCSSAAESSN